MKDSELIDLDQYVLADKWLHWLAQLLAKVNRTYLTKQPDDSHTNLSYSSISRCLSGRWISTANDGRVLLRLRLRDHNVAFEWIDDLQRVVHQIAVYGKTRGDSLRMF